MKPLEWRGVEVQLKGLESELKLKYGEEGRGNDIGCAEWERATVPVLPAGAFVWLDDFKKFRHWTFNKGDSPDATELMLTPCLDAATRATVMAGIPETLPPAAKGKAAQGTNPGGDAPHALGSLEVFRSMINLSGEELSIAFIGDKAEHTDGIGANNMLKISARKETRTVAFASLDLVNKNPCGGVNGEGGILIIFRAATKT